MERGGNESGGKSSRKRNGVKFRAKDQTDVEISEPVIVKKIKIQPGKVKYMNIGYL